MHLERAVMLRADLVDLELHELREIDAARA
jgi:hypothetical protein